MFKFAIRPNLIYPFQLMIWNFIRTVDKLIIIIILKFGISSIFTLLMFLGEFILGLIAHLYQQNFLSKNKEIPKFMSIVLYQPRNILKIPDKKYKIMILLFFASFFDFVQFIITSYIIPKYFNLSMTLRERLCGIYAIISALLFYYILKFQIYKHQIFSLIIIGINLLIVIITEFFFQEINIFLSYRDLIIAIIIIMIHYLLNSSLDIIEKYLFEVDYYNPFEALMWQGIFGFFITFVYFYEQNALNDIIQYWNENSLSNFVALMILFFLYIILSGVRNIFRVITNKIYSPMTKALTDYIMNPATILFEFSIEKDFLTGKRRNYGYFFLNLIISIIITICGCIHNEILVLYFCGLEYQTHDQISKRAKYLDNEISSFPDDYSERIIFNEDIVD